MVTSSCCCTPGVKIQQRAVASQYSSPMKEPRFGAAAFEPPMYQLTPRSRHLLCHLYLYPNTFSFCFTWFNQDEGASLCPPVHQHWGRVAIGPANKERRVVQQALPYLEKAALSDWFISMDRGANKWSISLQQMRSSAAETVDFFRGTFCTILISLWHKITKYNKNKTKN